jgi:hypothetical protein
LTSTSSARLVKAMYAYIHETGADYSRGRG